MDIVIEKGIKMPKNSRTMYPFKGMKVGDSFTLPENKRSNVSSMASIYKRKNPGKSFVVTNKNQPEGIIRVFRVS